MQILQFLKFFLVQSKKKKYVMSSIRTWDLWLTNPALYHCANQACCEKDVKLN